MSVPSYHLCVWTRASDVLLQNSCTCFKCNKHDIESEIYEILMVAGGWETGFYVCKSCVAEYPITYDFYHKALYGTSWYLTAYSMKAFIRYSGGKTLSLVKL